VGPRAGLDGGGISRPQSGFDPRTVQPVANRYTFSYSVNYNYTVVICLPMGLLELQQEMQVTGFVCAILLTVCFVRSELGVMLLWTSVYCYRVSSGKNFFLLILRHCQYLRACKSNGKTIGDELERI
jgi:hypothetical protein